MAAKRGAPESEGSESSRPSKRIIEHVTRVIDLSDPELENVATRLTIAPRDGAGPAMHIDLDPAEARALAHSLLSAADADEPDADWPPDYWTNDAPSADGAAPAG